MLSKQETEFYYYHWLNSILKMYIKNFASVSWRYPSELLLKESKNRIPWDKKSSDDFIYHLAYDKTLLGRDILRRGMYFPFFNIGDHVLLGHHRLYSLKLLNPNKKFLCVNLNENHIGDAINKNDLEDTLLKYENDAGLGFRMFLEIPRGFIKPQDSRDEFDYLVLNNKKVIKEKFIEVEISTYRDMMDVLKIAPHWLKNYFYRYDIPPGIVINSEEAFNKWIAK